MSAQLDDAGDGGEELVCSDLEKLAPKMERAVAAALAECWAEGLDAKVYESVRSDELQRIYFARGRAVIPPTYTVTNARTAQFGWHFFGLAVDVISKSRRWQVTPEWRKRVTDIFVKHGMSAGLYWPHPDAPHYQWGLCRRSPSEKSRLLYKEGAKVSHELGLRAVWEACEAI